MQSAMEKLTKRITDKFIVKYEEFIKNNLLIYKNDPCVTHQIVTASKEKYEACDQTLMTEKEQLYQQYVEKQKLLKQLNNETTQLQNEFNHTLKSINDNYQSMKSEVAEQHQLLLNQLQSNFGNIQQTQSAHSKDSHHHALDTKHTIPATSYDL